MSEGAYDGVAIIGMACRFPGADNIEEFLANLRAGKDSITFWSDDDLRAAGLDPVALKERGRYVPARGVLRDAGCFDAAFFDILPKEAEAMDPQQRLFLETCWTALEHAGYAPKHLDAAVFAGSSMNTYYPQVIAPNRELQELVGPDVIMFGNERDFLATRVAYKLDLRGPAVTVSTACSSSLVAIHQACQALLLHQCNMSLAGCVTIRFPQESGYFFQEGSIGSPDGRTRTFDEAAAGTVSSNGVGVVVLRRLEDAVRDGDSIYAVIKGSAINNDGSARVGFTAPGVEGQAEVIATAQALAGVDPGDISYVEAHGTATPLGDPIEIAALTKAFRLGTDKRQFCAIGSVKSNIGHLDVAAGMAGLIKTSLALHHHEIPASLHFRVPNPRLELETTPFYVNAELRKWESEAGRPRIAGLSSFGMGGTNAHAVLEEAPELPPSGPARPFHLLALSAKTTEALDRATGNLAHHLRAMASDGAEARDLADVSYTLQTGRVAFPHRRIVTCRDAAEGASYLESWVESGQVFTHSGGNKPPSVVFMFPGQGSQYPGMGANLYRSEPVFRNEVDLCAEILAPVLSCDLRDLVFTPDDANGSKSDLLRQTQFTQPALFVIEYALAKLWMSWGIQPDAFIGHSVGEYTAGCLAGVFPLEDAIRLVARRAALVQSLPGGAMLGVRLPAAEVTPLLNSNLAIAAVNGPRLCVVSGTYDAVSQLETRLTSSGAITRRLRTSHAFHSSMMDPILATFTDEVRKVRLTPPQIPYISNVTGTWITDQQATSPEYWGEHVRQAVHFSDGVNELTKDANRLFLEVGPGSTLATFVRQHGTATALSALPTAGLEEVRGVMETLGRLWKNGVDVDWKNFHGGMRRKRVAVPTYPFDRKRCWPESPVANGCTAEIAMNRVVTAAPREQSAGQTALEPPVPAPALLPSPARKERLQEEIRSLLGEISGKDFSKKPATAELLELGLDSLLLTQVAQLLQRRYKVPITFRQLMEKLSTVGAIAAHLDKLLPPEVPKPPAPQPASVVAKPAAAVPASVGQLPSGASSIEVLTQLLQQQQVLTNHLLQFMGQHPALLAATPVAQAPAPVAPDTPNVPVLTVANETGSHGPFKPIDRAASLALNASQEQFLRDLIRRYNQRTSQSKQMVAENRALLADPRTASGFKQLWKEMVYPIVTTRSEGSRVWDVDGNEYVDFVMGFGANLFGHRPPFVVEAMHRQLDLGFEIGPIQPLAYEVAALMREFTGMQRIGFTNTGSEAVLAATRLARTVTGRDKIAIFAGAYHGIFDEVLVRPLVGNGELRTLPIAPGITSSAVSQVIVLDYGNPQSLDIIRARGGEIAAVLVEPVQSRRLDLQPKEFLHALREVTKETGSALIFDEIVTGFRVQPGGAQAYFGVKADLATYGKVIGGGVSVGVVAGDARFMDALDGGNWQYGDSSFPEVGVTFLAGTFVRHPLALAAAKAVLLHLKQEGPDLQARLTERTARLADDLRAVIAEFGASYLVTQFSSIIQLKFPPEAKLAGLLFYLLRQRGIHIWENRALVITTAHSEEDFRRLVNALRDSLAELRSGGLLADAGVSSPPPESQVVAVASDRSRSTGSFPLTEAQKEIWLAAQLSGDATVAYNESLKLEFRGSFETELFREAVRQVVARHPILTACIDPDGQTQTVDAGAQIVVTEDDLSSQAETERSTRLVAIFNHEVSEGFDLAAGPLLRVRIVRLQQDHHVVVWTVHHIVCDGWSSGVVLSELAAIYSGLKRGEPAVLGSPGSFKEYAIASQQDSPAGIASLQYWKDRFSTIPQPLDLPTDRPRPVARSARSACIRRIFDEASCQAWKQVSGRQRTTLVVLLLAGVKTLLHRLTGQTDLVIGLGAAGQAVTDNKNLVGHCLNLLPVRSRVQPDAGFQDTLAEVKRNVLDAFDHHNCTIGGLLQHLPVRRSASRPPLVEVIFNVDRDPGAVHFEGVEFSCKRNPKVALHYDLFFNFTETSGGLILDCDYNTDLFEPETIARWLGHLQMLLDGVSENPAELVRKLPLLSQAERRSLLVERNLTETEFPQKTALTLFEEQVAKRPQAIAVTQEGGQWTYAELAQHSDRIAQHLKGLGVGPGGLVGIYVERSMEMLAALLGIWKAGGAYLPLDPAYPKSRLAFIVEDAQPVVVLTEARLRAGLPETSAPEKSAKVALLEDCMLEGSPCGESKASLEGLAYVLYTSGSTGKPKGVAIRHRSLTNLLHAMAGQVEAAASDVMLAITTISFDIAGLELFLPLTIGARVAMVSQEVAADGRRLSEAMEKMGVTIAQGTPATWEMLLDSGWRVKQDLKILCGGEALPPGLAQRLRTGGRLWNVYGPTETTIWSSASRLPAAGNDVSIGRPLNNTSFYVLDKEMQLVPLGVPGELYIGGAGLAEGYWKRPELTAEKFVADPFSSQPGARLYRTGDLVRYRPGGGIDFLGRIDSQVKIRGFRIELGEIETVLGRHPGVRQCAVIAREDEPGNKILVAYFETRPGPVCDAAELRSQLKKELPEYMVPTAFVQLDKLPLTPNGKIDRKALPAPDKQRSEGDNGFVPPQDAMEQTIAGIWAKVLRVERVGLHDDFFEIGGHSLLAVRIMAQIEDLYGKRLPLATLFQSPTVAGLAAVLRKEQPETRWSSLVPIRPNGSRTPLFLIHSHGGNVLEYYSFAARLDPDQPVYALQSRGLDGNFPTGQSIEEIASAYLAEIRSQQPRGPYMLGGFCFGGVVAWEAAQQLIAAGEEVSLLVLIQTANPVMFRSMPETPRAVRWLREGAYRVGVEAAYLEAQGIGHVWERLLRFRDVTKARAELSMVRKTVDTQKINYVGRPVPLILEALGREHEAAIARYQPKPYFGKTLLLRARKQWYRLENELSLGWENLAYDLTVLPVPGYQQTLLMEPNVKALAEQVDPHLREANVHAYQPVEEHGTEPRRWESTSV